MTIDIGKIFRTKAEVLCWGLKTNHIAKTIYSIQHPSEHKRTGNSGLHLLIDGRLVINAIYGEEFCELSPYTLREIDKKPWLFKENRPICECSVIMPPKWYLQKTKNGTMMEEIFLQEGRDTLITAIWNNCCYFSKNLQCQFCVLGYNKGLEFKKLNQVVEAAETALQENPNYYLHLTG